MKSIDQWRARWREAERNFVPTQRHAFPILVPLPVDGQDRKFFILRPSQASSPGIIVV
jgi:hypothetical protein